MRRTHTVLATEGISTLGGDDFDRVLAELAVGPAALAALDPAGAVSVWRRNAAARKKRCIPTRGAWWWIWI